MVRDMEAQFGCRLFDRTTRTVSLTREGLSLLPSVERILNEMEAATAAVQASATLTRRMLSIAVTPAVATNLMPQTYRSFSKIAPDVELQLRDVTQRDIQGLVERGEVDVGFSIFLKPSAGIEAKSLHSFQLVYIAPAGTLGPRRGTRHPKKLQWCQLPPLPLFSLPADTPLQQAIDAHLRNAAHVTKAYVCNSMQTVVAMVAAGRGAAILPSLTLPCCADDAFDIGYLSNPVAQLPFYMISRKGRELPESVRQLCDAMADVISSSCTVGNS